MNYKLISIDLAKTVFQVAGLTDDNQIGFNRKVNRTKLLDTLRQLEPTRVAMEACYSSNYWGREIGKLGHEVVLVPAKMVKPFLVGNKNDANDAVAILETAQRPNVHFVRVKSPELQDMQALLRIRERLIANQTANTNQLRCLLAEYGEIIPKGINNIMKTVPLILEDAENQLTQTARRFILRLYQHQYLFTEQLDEVTLEPGDPG